MPIRKINAASCAPLALRFDIGSVFNRALADAGRESAKLYGRERHSNGFKH